MYHYLRLAPVNTNTFQVIVSNYTSLERGEAESMIELVQQYPYSQLIHHLAARASQDYFLPNHDHYLHQSAVYSTDRSILRQVMTAPRIPRKSVEPVPVEIEAAPAFTAPIEVEKTIHLVSQLSGDAFYNEVEEDLKKLAQSKLRFEQVVEALENAPHQPLTPTPTPAVAIDPPVQNEILIEVIKNSKETIQLEGPKQKEQIEIIDEFIKTQPSISPARSVTPKVEDLSEKYDIYGDNIVSETLVEILLKQGKNEKAVEMLKKLIWKFPQKKAYFAAQIEALKK
jgi:tetratricopeptide (TPR) repeat protein